jgi:hypothetical protein
MKLRGRTLIRGMTALSLLFFITSLSLWTTSYWRSLQFGWFDHHSGDNPDGTASYDRFRRILSSGGGLIFQDHHDDFPGTTVIDDKHDYQWVLDSATEYPYYVPYISGSDPLLNPPVHKLRWLGFQWVYPLPVETYQWTFSMTVPLAALAALTAILPAFALRSYCRKIIRRRRVRKILCAFCGYDLRATPDQCPECGAIPQPRQQLPKVENSA